MNFVEEENLEMFLFLISLMISFCFSLVLPSGDSIWNKVFFIMGMTPFVFCGILLILDFVTWLENRKMKKETSNSNVDYEDDLSFSYVNKEND